MTEDHRFSVCDTGGGKTSCRHRVGQLQASHACISKDSGTKLRVGFEHSLPTMYVVAILMIGLVVQHAQANLNRHCGWSLLKFGKRLAVNDSGRVFCGAYHELTVVTAGLRWTTRYHDPMLPESQGSVSNEWSTI